MTTTASPTIEQISLIKAINDGTEACINPTS